MSINAPKNRKIGRPRVDSEAVHVRLDRSALAALDDWRRAQPDLPGRPEGIRRLVGLAILAQPLMGSMLEMLERSREASDPDVQRSISELRAALGKP